MKGGEICVVLPGISGSYFGLGGQVGAEGSLEDISKACQCFHVIIADQAACIRGQTDIHARSPANRFEVYLPEPLGSFGLLLRMIEPASP